MKPSDLSDLMHRVLDGEAGADEVRELDRVLAADPAARAKFDDLKRLFAELSAVPMAYPPEGLVAAVTARVPQRPAPGSGADQLFSESSVLRHTSTIARGTSPGNAAKAQRDHQSGPYLRGDNMNEQKIGSKRKVWIGLSVAIAAVVVASQYVDFPPGGKNVSGTIVPAQRYRADQPGTSGVNAGGESGNAIPGSSVGIGTAGTGGAPTGGAPTGGAPTGGAPTGGAPTGGAPTGGAPTGGAPTGGAPTGGAPTGGAPTGGAPTGGAPTGGAPTGGAPTGGAPTGGAPTGGAPTGGAPTGGAPTGAAPRS